MSIARPDDPTQQFVREARERFVIAVEPALVAIAEAVRMRLIALADQPGNLRAMQQSQDDLVAYRGAESGWVTLARGQWRKTLSTAHAAAPSAPASLLQLTLVDDEAVESGILSSRLAQAIHDQAAFELNDLRRRVQHVEGGEDLAGHDVFRPETLARLLVDQWAAAGLQRTLWTRVQEAVLPPLLDVVVPAYSDANAFLVARGVMPEIDLKRFVRRSAGAVASGPAPFGTHAAGTGTEPSHFATGSPSQAGGASDGAAPSGTTTSTPFGLARQRAQSVLVSLKRFVGARLGIDASAPLPPAGGSPAFDAVLADAATQYTANAPSSYLVDANHGATLVQHAAVELRRRSSELKRQAPTTADKATVEIVALMFQAILAEERIPFSVRVWFARLQMPVLRVAVAEPAFFGTLQHPARMLIDRMGSVVMGFDAAAISGSALEGEIRRVVQVIEQYPETGQRVFKLVFDEFVAFLSKYLTQSDTTQRVMSVAQQVEQKETMAIQYTIELRRMLDDMPVPDEIREFLFKVWAEVLALAALRYGGQDAQTVTLKNAAAELVWAASAKPQRSERARVIQELPQLLQRLRQGMTLLGVTGEPQEAHIKTIGATLADAFMSKTEAIAPAKIEALARRLSNLEEVVGDEDATDLPLDAANIELLLGMDAALLEVVPDTGSRAGPDMLEWARELQVGQWFLLDHNGRASQVQFVWRSPRRQLHLFAASDGRSFLIQVGRLASYLQAGLLVPAEEETLTVRATREALAKLDANPERLLS